MAKNGVEKLEEELSENLRSKLITHTNIIMVIDTLVIALLYEALNQGGSEIASLYLLTSLILLFLGTSFSLYSLYMPYSKAKNICLIRDAEEKVASILDVIYIWSIVIFLATKVLTLAKITFGSYLITSLIINLLVKKFLEKYHEIYEKNGRDELLESIKQCDRRHVKFLIFLLTLTFIAQAIFLEDIRTLTDVWLSLVITVVFRFYTTLA